MNSESLLADAEIRSLRQLLTDAQEKLEHMTEVASMREWDLSDMKNYYEAESTQFHSKQR